MSEEKVYTINLSPAREAFRVNRAHVAMNILKKYIEKHTKVKPLIGQNLSRHIYSLGGKKVMTKVKVKVIVDGSYAKTELMGFEFNEKNKADLAKEAKEKKKKKEPKVEIKTEEKRKDGVPEEVKKAHPEIKNTETQQEKNREKMKTHGKKVLSPTRYEEPKS